MADTARFLAVKALCRFEREEAYSNILWENLLRECTLSEVDRSFASRLFFGVIERKLTLDALLGSCSSMPQKKVHPTVWSILRVGCYQLLYMERVPGSAAVNEAVKLTRVCKQPHAAGYVNAVLRSVLREKDGFFAQLDDSDKGWEIRYSCPREVIALWRDAYGSERCRALLESLYEPVDTCIRINALRVKENAFTAALSAAEVGFEPDAVAPGCLRLAPHAHPGKVGFREDVDFYYQDAASQIALAALDVQPGMRVADVCAAPGGKSFTAAQYLQGSGDQCCFDLYPQKCDTIRRRAEKLGIAHLAVACHDATAAYPDGMAGGFDRVICDVPCSGLGVLRRKPEIRYKPMDSAAELPALQYAILCRSAELVKVGGILQYSTCTLNPAENEAVVSRFLAEHPAFAPHDLPVAPCFAAADLPVSHQLTLFPPIHHTDGFYMASLIRKY